MGYDQFDERLHEDSVLVIGVNKIIPLLVLLLATIYPVQGRANTSYSGLGTLIPTALALDPCFSSLKTPLAFEDASIANDILIPAVGTKSVYVCSFTGMYRATVGGALFLVTALHGDSCNSGYVFYLYYQHMPATVVNLVALPAYGEGNSQVLATVPPNYDLCLQLSGTSPIFSGVIGYVQK